MRIVIHLLRLTVLLLAVGYCALVVLALLADRIIFQPHASSYERLEGLSTRAGEEQVVSLRIPSGGVGIAAVYLPNSHAYHTLLFSHGNAEDLGDDLPLLLELRDAGFSVLAYDYRGYGQSPGRSSEATLYQDAISAYDYLTNELGVAPERVIAFGRSLGSAAAIEVAVQRHVAGLIVEAPFLSAFRVLTRVPILPWDKFRNADKIRRVHCAVLVIQGRGDEVVPFWHGERLFALANSPKQALWVSGAGHNDVMLVASREYLSKLREFANSLAPHTGAGN